MANQFIQFCAHLKEKFPEGITTFDFERELSSNKDLLNFIKEVVKNIENNFEFSNDSLFYSHPDTQNSLPCKLGKFDSDQLILVRKMPPPITNSSNKEFSSESLVNSDEKEFDPILGSTGKEVVCQPLPTCPSLTNKKVCSPLSLNYFSGSSIKSTSGDIGVTEFKVNEADMKKDLNFLSRKYKLDYLFVANLLIDFNIPILQSTNVTASNCYFKLDDIQKNKIEIPCKWKIFRGSCKSYLVNFENNNGQLKAVLHDNCSQDSNQEVFKLTV